MDYHYGQSFRGSPWTFQHFSRPRFYSTSLMKAKQVRRDRARMTAFILRKTAENMPFYAVENNELAKFVTNNSVRPATPPAVTVDMSTQTTAESEPAEHSRLQAEYESVTQENNILRFQLNACENEKFQLLEENNKSKSVQEVYLEAMKDLEVRLAERSNQIVSLNLELSYVTSCNAQLKESVKACNLQIERVQSDYDDLYNMYACQEPYPGVQYEQYQSHQPPDPSYNQPRRGRRHRRGR